MNDNTRTSFIIILLVTLIAINLPGPNLDQVQYIDPVTNQTIMYEYESTGLFDFSEWDLMNSEYGKIFYDWGEMIWPAKPVWGCIAIIMAALLIVWPIIKSILIKLSDMRRKNIG